jgi:hypothetical protein
MDDYTSRVIDRERVIRETLRGLSLTDKRPEKRWFPGNGRSVPRGPEPKKPRAPRFSAAGTPYGWHRLYRPPLPLPGVYALYVHGRLLYIGSSRNLKTRLTGDHHHVSLFPVEDRMLKVRYCRPRSFDWLSLEARLIYRLRPARNVHGNRHGNRYEKVVVSGVRSNP